MNTGLYIHIPFCKSKCRYCDFNSFANREMDIEPYFCALSREIDGWAERVTERCFDTVYFGGGTPSFVDTALLCKCIRHLQRKFIIAKDCEITVECNPGTIGFEGFKMLKTAGVNRLSIGLQSTDDKMLSVLGRIHSVEAFEACLSAARKAGFENISVDLMYGLPDMTMEMWEKALEKAVSYQPQHISAYALKVEEGTPFAKMRLNLPDEDLCADMYEKAVEFLRKSGYCRYEISNFALPGRESRHNQKYWECCDFLGLGAGAYSCMDNSRFNNIPDICEYVTSVNSVGIAVAEKEQISFEDQMSEFVFLGLRCEKGISKTEFEKRFGRKITDYFGKAIDKYVSLGFLIDDSDFLRFSDKGFFVSNTILSDFV